FHSAPLASVCALGCFRTRRSSDLVNATGQPRAASHLNQFGADLGGPLVKNRLFFYGAYRAVRNLFPRVANLSQPSLAMRNGDFSDRKITRLNSSHGSISYAVFCLK